MDEIKKKLFVIVLLINLLTGMDSRNTCVEACLKIVSPPSSKLKLTTDQQGRTTIIMTYVSSHHMTQIRESVKEKVFF